MNMNISTSKIKIALIYYREKDNVKKTQQIQGII
jgi:hypothetical protein